MPQHHVLETPKIRKLIIGMILDGSKDTAIARALASHQITVTRQAIGSFRRRHANILEPAETERVAEVIASAKLRWIADKDERLSKIEGLYNDTESWVEEHSLSERSVRYDKDGNEVGETIRFRADVVNALRGLLNDAADTLGQKPKTPVNVNIDNRTQVLIRQVVGTSVELG